MTLWLAVLATAAGCYLLKFVGMAAPRRLLDHPVVRRFATIVPIALLAALIALQAVTEGNDLVFDVPRLAGLAAAAVALLLRAQFLVVMAVAAGTAAILRAFGVG